MIYETELVLILWVLVYYTAKCIDSYTKKRSSGDSSIIAAIDARQEEIVNRMFSRCFNDGQFKQAMGIAIETRRMDMFVGSIRYVRS